MMMSGKDFLKSHVLIWRQKVCSDWEDVTSSNSVASVIDARADCNLATPKTCEMPNAHRFCGYPFTPILSIITPTFAAFPDCPLATPLSLSLYMITCYVCWYISVAYDMPICVFAMVCVFYHAVFCTTGT